MIGGEMQQEEIDVYCCQTGRCISYAERDESTGTLILYNADGLKVGEAIRWSETYPDHIYESLPETTFRWGESFWTCPYCGAEHEWTERCCDGCGARRR